MFLFPIFRTRVVVSVLLIVGIIAIVVSVIAASISISRQSRNTSKVGYYANFAVTSDAPPCSTVGR